MNNNNSNYILSQQEISKWDEIINPLSGTCSDLFNYFAGLANITNRSIPSQTYLAKKFGVCRATINRSIKKLAELGLIQKIDRGWKEDRTRVKKTCFYIVSRIFDLLEIRKRYAHKFKSLSYLKLITNFDQIIESGYKHCINIVTGIKSSSYSLFINKEEGNLGYRVNTLRRRRHVITVGLKQEESKLTIEEGSKMNEFISGLGGFNEAAKVYLSAYREDIVKEAIRGLGNRQLTGNPWLYFLKILSRVSREKNVEPDYQIINSVLGNPVLTLPVTSSSLIARSSSSFQKKEQIQPRQEPKYLPESPDLRYDWTNTKEFNLKKMSDYVGSKEVDEYILKYGDKGKQRVMEWIERFKRQMDEYTPAKVERLYKYCYLIGEFDVMRRAEVHHAYLKKLGLIIPDKTQSKTTAQFLQNLVGNLQEPTHMTGAKDVNTVPMADNFEDAQNTINEEEYEEVFD